MIPKSKKNNNKPTPTKATPPPPAAKASPLAAKRQQEAPATAEDFNFVKELIRDTNKEAGEKIAFNLAEDSAPTNVKRWIPTGSRQLDYIVANRRGGGYPEGRVIEIQGPQANGKSHLAIEASRATQRMGGIVVYIDAENATSLDNLKSLGLDVGKRFVYVQETCMEKIFAVIENVIIKARNMKNDLPILVIWDSVAASSPKAELEGDYEQNTIGLAARVLSKGFRKITHLIGDKNVCLLLINQQRMKIGCVNPHTTTIQVSALTDPTNGSIQCTVKEFFAKLNCPFEKMVVGEPVEVNGWKVRTINTDTGNVVWSNVTKIVRKPSAVAHRLITTTAKHQVEASGDHKVFVKDIANESYHYATLEQLYGKEENYRVRTESGYDMFEVWRADPRVVTSIDIADIEVEGEHSYLSNGILSHNTLYGDPVTTPGGNAIPYHASLRLKLSGGQQIKRTVNGREMVVGIAVDVKVIKNKVARPWRQCSFEIHFGKGIVESEQLFDELRQYCEKSGKALVNGKHISVSGTQAWKTFEVSDAESGEVLHEIKFQKSSFQELVIDNPLVKNYFDDLVDAAFIIGNTDEHFSFASVDTDSHEEVSAAKLEADGGKAATLLLND